MGSIFQLHFGEFLGKGVFSSDGDIWYKHRKTSSHLFNLNVFKNGVLDTFNHHGEEMMAKIASYKGAPFDIQNVLFRFTLDSIGQIAFGTSFDSQQQDSIPFADAFDYLQYEVNMSFLDPFWRIKRQLAPSGRKFYRCLKLVNDIAFAVVKQRKKEFKESRQQNGGVGEAGRSDIISLYLQRHDEEKDGELSDDVLRDVVINFMIAGRDTTANALSWSFYRLCLHPEIQTKLAQEILEVLEKHQIGVPPAGGVETGASKLRVSYECLQEMRYLDAFAMEVLRLHPSVPREAKFALKKDTLPDGTEVAPGMMISYHPYTMGRTKALWGEDCLEFKPERFLGVPKPSPFIFSAFQAGPRICLGQNLALLEMKYALARLLASFQFKLEQDPSTVTYVPTIALPIKDHLLVSATPRAK